MSIQSYGDPFKFPEKCFAFMLELVDEFTEIVSSAFGPFIGHHQGLFASVKIKKKFLGLQKLRKRIVGLNWDADNVERI